LIIIVQSVINGHPIQNDVVNFISPRLLDPELTQQSDSTTRDIVVPVALSTFTTATI